MSDTPNLALPLVAEAQAAKHVTINEALMLLDAATGLVLASVTETAPPAVPAEGSVHHVPAAATGDWAGRDGLLAIRIGGGWVFRAARAGLTAFIADEGRLAVHAPPHGWRTVAAVGPWGAATLPTILEEEVALAGAFVETAAAIPDRALVLAVTTRTVEEITGAASYDCGVAGEAAKFGGSLGVALGSTNTGVVGPTATYAPTPVRLTANGGAFTGGRVRLAIHCLTFAGPAG